MYKEQSIIFCLSLLDLNYSNHKLKLPDIVQQICSLLQQYLPRLHCTFLGSCELKQ